MSNIWYLCQFGAVLSRGDLPLPICEEVAEMAFWGNGNVPSVERTLGMEDRLSDEELEKELMEGLMSNNRFLWICERQRQLTRMPLPTIELM